MGSAGPALPECLLTVTSRGSYAVPKLDKKNHKKVPEVLPKVIQPHPPCLQPSGFLCLPGCSVAASFCVYLHKSDFLGGLSHTSLISMSLEAEESWGQARPVNIY